MRRERCRRPIEDHEIPYLDALGAALRELRQGRSRLVVAQEAQVSVSTIERIESGQRRTRRSTLARIVSALDKPEALDHLVDLAGPALALESAYAERVAKRRARRHRRKSLPDAASLRLLREFARRPLPAEYAAYETYGE